MKRNQIVFTKVASSGFLRTSILKRRDVVIAVEWSGALSRVQKTMTRTKPLHVSLVSL